MAKTFLLMGAALSLLAVVFGAFGAHALKDRLSEKNLEIFTKASQYHFYHALGLIALGLLAMKLGESGALKISGYSMFTGVVLFSGSLYVLALTDNKALGMITPFGGLALIVAWAFMFTAVYKSTI
jgi:uncharacterized membrane protein YgdD (TMEM256/DUF423 family)